MAKPDVLIELLKVIPITIVGAITLYVAWQQWQTNQQRLRLELYDRRLRIYNEVRSFIAVALNDMQTDNYLAFSHATREADFLFGPDGDPITAYLRDLSSHGKALLRWNQEFRDTMQPHPPGYDHQSVINAIHEEKQWFAKQHEEGAFQTFRNYLNLWA